MLHKTHFFTAIFHHETPDRFSKPVRCNATKKAILIGQPFLILKVFLFHFKCSFLRKVGHFAQFLFNSEQLVVFCHTVGTGSRSGFNLSAV